MHACLTEIITKLPPMVNVALVEHALDNTPYVMKSFKLIITLEISGEESEEVLHMFMNISKMCDMTCDMDDDSEMLMSSKSFDKFL